ncbi:MAG: stage V sporulation T C-terminal domain-containing protein [Acutalibacteraceae bacterium]|nr:stage V sporulation T C-terminal domain-containing protein [Acutalibacteraceae bacterium]
MKATGIVRRIDDLGRVVIPKEIRRTLRIREGDPLEIYTDSEGEVIFKKYSPVGELSSFAASYSEVISKTSGVPTLISDRDHIVSAAGVSKREFLERRVTSATEELMESRRTYNSVDSNYPLQPVEGIDSPAMLIYPIISSGDVTGSVIMLCSEDRTVPSEADIKLAQSASSFLGKQMEE